MKKVTTLTAEILAQLGHEAPVQELKRAYWRNLKQGGGYGDDWHRAFTCADYLILNRIATRSAEVQALYDQRDRERAMYGSQ